MKLWIDDVRPAPLGYVWCKSVYEVKTIIEMSQKNDLDDLEEFNFDHDAGDYAIYGGDYIRVLDWMEETGYTPNAIHIHSMNPVGIQNMRRIIQKNGWREI